jgi:glycosyltransferase involved in cell wall biosynthesis
MGGVPLLTAVPVPRRPVASLEPLVDPARYTRLVEGAQRFRRAFAGRSVWNVNSTATGGGVAEMLQGLVGYTKDLDVPVQWAFGRAVRRLLDDPPGAARMGAAARTYVRDSFLPDTHLPRYAELFTSLG